MIMAGEPRGLETLLDVRLPDDGDFARVASRWLNNLGEVLAPALWDELQESLPLPSPGEWDAPHGAPGGVWACVSVVPRPCWGTAASRVYSPENFRWMLENAAARPLMLEHQLIRLGRDGALPDGPEDTGGGRLVISVEVEEEHPEWVQMKASSSLPDYDNDASRTDVSTRWVQAVLSRAREVDASFGHVCDDGVAYGKTALDSALRRGGRVKSMMQSRQVLRGYSWCTICPRELAQRLGGSSALQATGAFVEVEELPSGGLWLQATESFSDYNDEAMKRVFKALAPVLPEGLPKPDPFDDIPRRLVWEDAADWR